MLLYAANCQGYSFYCFSVIKEKPKGGEAKTAPTQISVNVNYLLFYGQIFMVHTIYYMQHVFLGNL